MRKAISMEQENNQLPKIDLIVLLEDFWREARRLWAAGLVLVLLCAGGLMGYRYLTYEPVYQAAASFTVKVANPLYSGISSYNAETAEQMAKTFPYILTSGVLQQRVKAHLGISVMPSVGAEAMGSTNIITLKVRDGDPQRAYDVLNAVITYYPEIAEYVVGPTELCLLDESGVPTQPVKGLQLSSSVKRGALIGIALWLLAAGAAALTKTTIRSEEQLKKVLNLECMGQIPSVKAGKAACPLISSKVWERWGFGESVGLLRLHVQKQMEESGRKILLVSSAVPGEGKTTVAVNLAASLAQKGKRVALIDCDLRNPSVARALQMPNEQGMADYLSGGITARELLRPTPIENLWIIPGGSAERGGHAEWLSQERSAQLIQAVARVYDYVILDTPPCSLLADAAEAAELAESALMVIRQDLASQDQILDGVQCLMDSRVPILGCVLNGVERNGAGGHGYGYGYGYGYG